MVASGLPAMPIEPMSPVGCARMSPTASTTLVPSNRGGRQGIQGAGHAVLADHQAIDRRAEGILQHFDRLDVIDAEHLPFGGTGRRTDRGGSGDPGVVGHFIHRHQFRLTNAHRRRAEHPAMLRPAAATRRKYRAAAACARLSRSMASTKRLVSAGLVVRASITSRERPGTMFDAEGSTVRMPTVATK